MNNTIEKKNTFRNVLIGILLLLLLFIGYQSNKLAKANVDINIAKQNQKALADSVRIGKNKAGELEFSKNVLIAEKDELKNLNMGLYNELQKGNGKISELSEIIAVIQRKPNDTIVIPNKIISYPNGNKGVEWEYEKYYDDKNYRIIKGVSDFKFNFTSATYEVIPLTTKIIKDDIGFNIIQGLRETKNGDVEMFVRSDYPEFSVKELNSVIINPKTHPILTKFSKESKQKRFGVGVFAGYGIYVDNFNNTAGFGAQLGFGVTYSLFNF